MRLASGPAPLRPREREALRRARWTIVSQVPGRLRVRHALLPRYAVLPLRIASALARLPGVTRFSISLPTSKVLIRYRPDLLTPGEILRLLSRLLTEAAEEPALARLDVWQRGLNRAWLQVSLSSANMVLATASLAAPPLLPAALVLGLLASGHILAQAVWALFVERRLRVDVLDAAAILCLLHYRRVIPAGLLVLIVDLGNVLLEATSRSSRELLSRVFEQRPGTAWRLVDGQEVEIDAADLQAGDLVVARAGDPIPADGTVVAGEATVDQRILTGESIAAERSVGDFVFAMTTVLTGELTVLVRQAGAETNAAKIVAIIEESVRHKTRLQSQGERFAERMVLPTLGLSAAGFATAGADSMVAILNADYGTGIRVAAPLSLLSAISIAARRGVLVKDGGALEAVREIDTVVFDKTGTLTTETPEVGRVRVLDPAFSEARIVAYAACAEQRLEHPIARALRERAGQLELVLPVADASSYRVGLGILVRIAGEPVRLGSVRFMEREAIPIPPQVGAEVAAVHAAGHSALLLAVGARLAGLIELQSSTRPEAARVVDRLRSRWGIREIHLLSGDHEAATRSFAEKLGISRYLAEVLPQEKAEYVRQLQLAGRKVVMVGDGVNDAIALSQADCSVSFHGAADVATDVADMVLMDGDLGKLDLILDLSAQLDTNIRRSFGLILVANSVCIAGALLGVFGIGTSLVLNNVFNLASAMNGLLPFYRLSSEVEREEAGRTTPSPAR